MSLDPCDGSQEQFSPNGGDLLCDADDPGCASPAEKDCFDGVDKDNDGLVDCADQGCAAASQISACGSVGQFNCVPGARVRRSATDSM